MTDLHTLITRLEQATGPTFALEHEIARAVGYERTVPPAYMSSLDVALTLVPDDSEWFIQKYGDGRCEAGIMYSRAERSSWNIQPGFTQQDSAMANSPAIAVVIAALRARTGKG